jgi:ketosteroid isomerase-like protein
MLASPLRSVLGRASLTTLLFLLALGCVSADATSSSERAQVEQVLRAYEDAYNARDARALAAVHAEDGAYVTAEGDPIRGRAALEQFWAEHAGMDLVLVLEAFDLDSELGWATGTWGSASESGPPKHGGRFVLALRREGGEWKIALDINNEAR